MKKFTQINESNNGDKNLSINDRILNLLESLDIEIVGVEKPWVGDVKINPSEDFYKGIKNIINEEYGKEKMSILENAKTSVVTKDISWIDDEIDKLKNKDSE
jgi:hypothetical protein